MFPSNNIDLIQDECKDLIHVPITIDCFQINALIDTGSAASFINNDIVKLIKLKTYELDSPASASVIGGQITIIYEYAIVEFTAKNEGKLVAYTHSFLIVSTMDEDIILGLDFCKAYISYIYFDENKIKMKNITNPNCTEEAYINLDPEILMMLGSDPNNTIDKNQQFNTLIYALAEVPLEKTRTPEINIQCAAFHTTVGYATSILPITTNDKDFDFDTIISTDNLEFREQIKNLISRYKHLFAVNASQLTKAKGIEHKFELTDYKPINKSPYRTSAKEKEIIKTQVNEMLEQQVIRPSKSDYASPVVLVKKKNGDMRFCIDNRALNAITVKDRFPLPLIDDLIHNLQGCHYISTFDLYSGYWQIPIKEDHKKYTAFICCEGLFEFNVLNFGLSNAPAVFQRLMQKVFSGYLWIFVLVYIDDIIIYSKTFKEHLVHLELAFKRLEEYNLKLQPKKCLFLPKETKFLGYIISNEGISPDVDKIIAVREFPKPKNQRDVRAFLGLTGYYRSMIQSYARIAKPLTTLLKKNPSTNNAPVEWNPNCEEAFQKLKNCLLNSPILAHFKAGEPLILYTDASNFAMGWVLHQLQDGRERVLVYGSKTFTATQLKYCVTDKECLAVVTAILKLRHFLAGENFIVRTDHHALCWLMKIKDVSGRLARYSLRLQEFDFKIEYKSGKAHNNCDALSRFPAAENHNDNQNSNEESIEEIPVYQITLKNYKCAKQRSNCLSLCEINTNYELNENYTIAEFPELGLIWKANVFKPTSNDQHKIYIEFIEKESKTIPVYNIEELDLKSLQKADPWISDLLVSLNKEKSKHKENFEIYNGLVYRKTFNDSGQPKRLLCIPRSIRPEVLQEVHAGLTGGHYGVMKTLHKIHDRFYWPKRDKTVRKFVQSCTCCQYRKIDQGKPKGLLQPIPIEKPFDLVGIDIVGKLPLTSDKQQYIISAVDYATRFAIVDSTENITAKDISDFFIKRIIGPFGCPRRLLTDRGRQFIAKGLESVLAYFNTDHSFCSKYHPQCQGLVERQNRTLVDSISKYCNTDQTNWSKILPFVQLAHNSSVGKSTQFSPHYALFGYEPTLPIDISLRLNIGSNFNNMENRWTDARTLVKQYLGEAQKEQKNAFDKKHREVIFNNGDLVAIYKKARKKGKNEKMMCNFSGPWIVLKKYDIPENLYLVANPSNLEMTENVPVVHMKKWYEREDENSEISEVSDIDDLSDPDDSNSRTHMGPSSAAAQ